MFSLIRLQALRLPMKVIAKVASLWSLRWEDVSSAVTLHAWVTRILTASWEN